MQCTTVVGITGSMHVVGVRIGRCPYSLDLIRGLHRDPCH